MGNPTPTKVSLFLNLYFVIFLLLYLKTRLISQPGSSILVTGPSRAHIELLPVQDPQGCSTIHDLPDHKSKCSYVRSDPGCRHKGYINYLEIFYCTLGTWPFLGHAGLFLWLIVLFYLLGNTAADYFCPSLESLSKIMRLSPTIAGVTLLSLGNGAPDVFASIISFTRTGNGNVGLNSVLGGAFFVSSVVVGVISMSIGPRRIAVERRSFMRDLLFFLFTLLSLLLIVSMKWIGLLGSICFVSIYFIYVCTVSAMHLLQGSRRRKPNPIPVDQSYHDDMGIPLLGYIEEDEKSVDVLVDDGLHLQESWQGLDSSIKTSLVQLLQLLELPLQLPRRLTIPVGSEERWSKPYAVISITLAPVLLAALCNTQRDHVGFKDGSVTYLTSGLIGIVLGNIAYATTKSSDPPKSGRSLWLSAGFLMSVAWTYIIAEELLSLLISVGIVLGISSSVLGLTVLAWGNSLGDLIANTAMAVHGGPDGAQIAISGCYAGPMFNALVGLGLPFTFESWSKYPSQYEIPRDESVYEMLGFFIGSLLWALVVVPRNGMRPDRFLGVGLLAIYFCFLSLRLARTTGLLEVLR
ncbi:hypothetical protein SAY87_030651 [Trapa incisa]|uniref:Sodium/calcium exchanger membrane region domain-containing protein n=1 Tax=Trapa incisa TaxID=236973 RepID=A0AAN7QK63_9MYRT|nr:hypothetical protein SAY87_030651 [Trapa incisa]